MKIPKPLIDLIDSFQKLPGIGPKTAQRLTYYMFHMPQQELDAFAEAVAGFKRKTQLCSICKNIGESDPCLVCTDSLRDTTRIMVVEQPLDLIAFERAGIYKGLYHVLHGRINPLDNIGPDEIFIEQLLSRVQKSSTKIGDIKEVIIATNPTMEGEATAMYLTKKLKAINEKLKVTRLGMGIPTGADLEYADETTLNQALEGRKEI